MNQRSGIADNDLGGSTILRHEGPIRRLPE
jgi:hypothetical protein